MALRPLGKVKELVESVGMGLSFAYDDLVFPEHNAFLLQFGEESGSLLFHANEQAGAGEIEEAFAKLEKAAKVQQLHLVKGKFYKLYQAEENTLKLEFF